MRVSRPNWLAFTAIVLPALAAAGPGDTARGEEPFRRTFISTRSNINNPFGPGQNAIISRYSTPSCRIPWSVRRIRMMGGKQEGTDLIWIDNGKIKIGVIPTRGLGILSVLSPEVRLGWDSPVQELVHPSLINLNARGGLGWLEGFNEWLCRCGMESMGQPGIDRFINNVGDEATMELTLHGRVANIPAEEVEIIVEREPPYQITLRGRVDERTVHGPKLELNTLIITEPGSSHFRIQDVVTNRGGQDQEFQMLYHMNFGPPILEEGARLLVPAERVTPMNDHAAKAIGHYDSFAGPKPGFIEEVYCMRPRAGGDGRTLALIHNKAGDRGSSIRFNTRELPYLTLWKNMAAVEDGYVIGIEPGTSFPNHRRVERKLGRVPRLAPGKSHAMNLDIAIHVGTAEVQQVAAEVAQIQGEKKPVIDDRPEKKEGGTR